MRRIVPPTLIMQGRRLAYLPLEVRDRLTGRRDPLRPPRWLHFVGGGDFDLVGAHFLDYFQRLGGLQPDADVLDIGCGVGRMALPLTGYLSPQGSYNGFDIVRPGIVWCQRRITPRFPHFQFTHADVYNAEYNPGGRFRAGEYRFPYLNAEFDFVFLTSVFTHMLPADVQHYLREIRRVLRPGGRCLATFFLLNPTQRVLMRGPHSLFNFRYAGPGYFTTTPERPEAAVAYDEASLWAMIAAAGLRVREPVHYGSWCGQAGAVEGQDILILERPAVS